MAWSAFEVGLLGLEVGGLRLEARPPGAGAPPPGPRATASGPPAGRPPRPVLRTSSARRRASFTIVGFARRWPAAWRRSAAAWASSARSSARAAGDPARTRLGLLLERRRSAPRPPPHARHRRSVGQPGLGRRDALRGSPPGGPRRPRRAARAWRARARSASARWSRSPRRPSICRDLALDAARAAPARRSPAGLAAPPPRARARPAGRAAAACSCSQLACWAFRAAACFWSAACCALPSFCSCSSSAWSALAWSICFCTAGSVVAGVARATADQQRAVVADAEAVGHEVVGLALGGVGRRRADVLLAELQREDRDREDAERDDRADDRDQRVAGDRPCPSAAQRPVPRVLGLGAQPGAAGAASRSRRPSSDEHGRQQGDRREHRGQHRHGRRVAERRDERDAGDRERHAGRSRPCRRRRPPRRRRSRRSSRSTRFISMPSASWRRWRLTRKSE